MWTPFPARHFLNPAFPGLKERFFHGIARIQAGKIVLSMETQLMSLNLVKITAWLEIQGACCKIDIVSVDFTGGPGIFFTVPTTLKYTLTSGCMTMLVPKDRILVQSIAEWR